MVTSVLWAVVSMSARVKLWIVPAWVEGLGGTSMMGSSMALAFGDEVGMGVLDWMFSMAISMISWFDG